MAAKGIRLILPSGLRLDVEDEPKEADVEVLPNGLEAFNESRWPGHRPWRPLGVFVRDGERIVAGLAGETYSGWLFIKYLWVSDGLGRQGIGRKLVSAGEERGAGARLPRGLGRHLQLSGARLLPELGFEVFGELDWSPEFKRFFLQKRLAL